MEKNTGLSSLNNCNQSSISIEQKILIFLYITTQGTAYRNAAEKFHHSLDTISRVFHEVLDACCLLYQRIVRISHAAESHDFLKENPKIWPFLEECLGALDECHISIAVPSSQQSVWRNRKGWISQNILVACDFDLNFIYIFARMEGSAHDSAVLARACNKNGFGLSNDNYFLADAGYSARSRLMLVPYSGVAYHLKKYAKTNKRPTNSKELFNLRHAGLRSCIKRVFGIFKRRFCIFNRARKSFSIKTQIKLVFALAAIHNFINQSGEDLIKIENKNESEGNIKSNDDDSQSDISHSTANNNRYMKIRRDQIAESMWRQYQDYLDERMKV